MKNLNISLPDAAVDLLAELARRDLRAVRQEAAAILLAAIEREAYREAETSLLALDEPESPAVAGSLALR